MPNNTIVGIYYNKNGDVAKIVHADNDDYSPHEQEGLFRVDLPKAEYEALPPAMNMGGVPVYHDLGKACSIALAQIDVGASVALQSKINQTDAVIAQAALDSAAAEAEALLNPGVDVVEEILP